MPASSRPNKRKNNNNTSAQVGTDTQRSKKIFGKNRGSLCCICNKLALRFLFVSPTPPTLGYACVQESCARGEKRHNLKLSITLPSVKRQDSERGLSPTRPLLQFFLVSRLLASFCLSGAHSCLPNKTLATYYVSDWNFPLGQGLRKLLFWC